MAGDRCGSAHRSLVRRSAALHAIASHMAGRRRFARSNPRARARRAGHAPRRAANRPGTTYGVRIPSHSLNEYRAELQGAHATARHRFDAADVTRVNTIGNHTSGVDVACRVGRVVTTRAPAHARRRMVRASHATRPVQPSPATDRR